MWMRGSERRFLQELDWCDNRSTTGLIQTPTSVAGSGPKMIFMDVWYHWVALNPSVNHHVPCHPYHPIAIWEYMSFLVKCPVARDCHASCANRLNHGAVSHALSTYWEVSCEKSQPNQPQDMLCRTRGEALLNALHVAGGSRDSPKWVQVAMLRNRFSLSVGRSELLFYNKLWKITMLSMGKSTINHHFQ